MEDMFLHFILWRNNEDKGKIFSSLAVDRTDWSHFDSSPSSCTLCPNVESRLIDVDESRTAVVNLKEPVCIASSPLTLSMGGDSNFLL